MELSQEIVSFGKFAGEHYSLLLRDVPYCEWCIENDVISEINYPFLFQKIKEYNPLPSFFPKGIVYSMDTESFSTSLTSTSTSTTTSSSSEDIDVDKFLDTFCYFHTQEPSFLEKYPTDVLCLKFFQERMKVLYKKIKKQREAGKNPFNITGERYLSIFEEQTKLPKKVYLNFTKCYKMNSYEEIIKFIKSLGGISYTINIGYTLGKENSKKQEEFWRKVLTDKWDYNVTPQFEYRRKSKEKCFFDFIHTENKVLYECKLNTKDFKQSQLDKYKESAPDFRILYLIRQDVVIYTKEKKVFVLKDSYIDFLKTLFTRRKYQRNSLEQEMIESYDFFRIDSLDVVV